MRTRKTISCIYWKNACLAQSLRDSERVKVSEISDLLAIVLALI